MKNLLSSVTTLLYIGILFSTSPAHAVGVTKRISVSSDDVQANHDSDRPVTSFNGRYTAFVSLASNLVQEDSNGVKDIFLHDKNLRTTKRISISNDGIQANGESERPSISSDGRYITFSSRASNLIPNDTNGFTDVFVYDQNTRTIERISVSSLGDEGNSSSFDPAISPDGRFIVFASYATNLIEEDSNGRSDIFLHDRQTGETSRVSAPYCTNSNGGCPESNGDSSNPSISHPYEQTLYISYESVASNLVRNDTNKKKDIFFHLRLFGADFGTALISRSYSGGQTNGDSWGACISSDAPRIAYSSAASNIVPGDTNVSTDVFVYFFGDVPITTRRASVNNSGAQGNGHSGGPVFSEPSISNDGRYIAFASLASNLISIDANGVSDVFVRDIKNNKTVRVSVPTFGPAGNGHSGGLYGPSLSGNGKFIVFTSAAINLVPNDTNNRDDIFERDWILPIFNPNPTT